MSKLSLNKCILVQAWESGSKRERETVAKEIDKLRGTIQTLTRTTNPLGKLLDYVQVIFTHNLTFQSMSIKVNKFYIRKM